MKSAPRREDLSSLFHEPAVPRKLGISATTIDYLRHSEDKQAAAIRERIRTWLRSWTFADQKDTNDLFSRLSSKDESQVQSALWEVYLNWLFLRMGYQVERVRQAPDGTTPDFVLSQDGYSFAVEAIAKNRYPKASPEPRWRQIAKYIDEAFRADFFIGMRPVTTPTSNPKLKKIREEIFAYLELDDSVDESGEHIVVVDDWKIAINKFRKPADSTPGPTLGILGSAENGFIPDQQDLKKLVESKRGRYKTAALPLVVAVLENTRIPGDNLFHRLGALYGTQAVAIAADLSHSDIRIPDGLWSRLDSDDQLVGLLLLDRLSYNQDHERIEFWVRPSADDAAVGVFSRAFATCYLDGEQLSTTQPDDRLFGI